ncbi:MAG: FtsX-like permease family protein [Flavobacteriales bacterium]|nr:FtsX-like permease family protein [Flavobacteriales bacterium]
MDAFVTKYIIPAWGGEQFHGDIRFNLEPLREVHFNNDLIYDTPKKGNKAYVTLFAIVAVLILAIACINYINMSTADATRRAKEVALRKVSGAQRGQLVAQFIGGSVMIAVIGILVALGLLWFCLPAFNTITEKEIGMGYLLQGSFFAVVLLIVLPLAWWPAAIRPSSSRASPTTAAEGRCGQAAGKAACPQGAHGRAVRHRALHGSGHAGRVRAIALAAHQRPGLPQGEPAEHHHAAAAGTDTLAWDALRPVKEELMRESFVRRGSFTQSLPGQSGGRWVLQVNTPEGRIDKPMPTLNVDADFPALLGIELAAGRYFDNAIPSDRHRRRGGERERREGLRLEGSAGREDLHPRRCASDCPSSSSPSSASSRTSTTPACTPHRAARASSRAASAMARRTWCCASLAMWAAARHFASEWRPFPQRRLGGHLPHR